jgi:uncharacterized protein (DUF2267 family)
MNDEELISAIREHSDLDDSDEVERAAYATLTVLGQRLASGEPKSPAADEGGSFSVDEFYDRVGQLEGTEYDDARQHARAVMAGVKAAIDRSEWDIILDQLPADYADLVLAGPAH